MTFIVSISGQIFKPAYLNYLAGAPLRQAVQCAPLRQRKRLRNQMSNHHLWLMMMMLNDDQHHVSRWVQPALARQHGGKAAIIRFHLLVLDFRRFHGSCKILFMFVCNVFIKKFIKI